VLVLRIVVGVLVGVFVAPFVAHEVRAPRLLEPTPDSEQSPVCKACRHQLRPDQRWFHFGGSVLRGVCPVCGNEVPVWAAWAEIATVVVAAIVGWRITEWAWIPAFLLFSFTCVAVVLIDARLHKIPTKLVYPASGLGLLLLAFAAAVTHDRDRFVWALVGGLGASLFLWILVLVSPKSMGDGDARLCLLLGLFLGWYGWRYVIYGLFLGFLLGSIGGLLLMARHRGGRKTLIAFGPYLATGALVVSLWPSVLDRLIAN
jgi:leader peptidase (prepilin peptidase) / N-methyltransferase